MEDFFIQRYTFKFLMFLSLVAGLVYLYTDHIDFISAAMEYNKMNVSNFGYVLLRIIGGVFIPAVFIVPSMFEFGRIRLARIFFIAYGICHLLTISWVIYFVANCPYIDIFSTAKVTDFLTEHGFVDPFTFWDTYSLMSVLFAIIYGVAAIYTGINLDKDKSLAKTFVCVLFTLRIVLPLLYNIMAQGRFFSLFWLTNNATALAAQLLFTVAIVYAGANNYTWIEFVWDQIAVVETEDGEDSDQNGQND